MNKLKAEAIAAEHREYQWKCVCDLISHRVHNKCISAAESVETCMLITEPIMYIIFMLFVCIAVRCTPNPLNGRARPVHILYFSRCVGDILLGPKNGSTVLARGSRSRSLSLNCFRQAGLV